MAQKPENIIYGLEERPPLGAALLLAYQHMIPPVSLSIFAVMVARFIGLEGEAVRDIASMSLLASAVGVGLQALRKGSVGSGYLAAHAPSAIYLPASLAAGAAGGPALIWGMTLFAGIFEAVLSRILPYLKRVFPPQVSGVVVTMVGLSLVAVAIRKFLGLDAEDHISELREVSVASLTMIILIGLSVWGKGWLRLYSILMSIGIGYIASLLLGIVDDRVFEMIARSAWFDIPSWQAHGWSFDWGLAPVFLVAALAASAKTVGLVVASQKINEPDMQEVDMNRAAKGVLADGLATAVAGLLGSTGCNVSPTSVSLTEATGATSRVVGFYTAGLLVLACFFPKVITLIALMPKPIMGSILVYAVCVITFSGLKLIMSAEPGPRLTYLVGFSILAGLSVELVPNVYDQLPAWGQLAFKSPVTVSAIVAIVLNLVFQIGRKEKSE